jgi:hypothetical protein
MTQVTPGMALRPSTISRRRAMNSARMASASSCGPVRASTAPAWAKAFVHETLLITSLLNEGTSHSGTTP